MEITLFIVQPENGGLPDEPFITTSEEEANKFYIEWWEEEADKKIKTIKQALRIARNYDCGNNNYCRYWQKTISI